MGVRENYYRHFHGFGVVYYDGPNLHTYPSYVNYVTELIVTSNSIEFIEKSSDGDICGMIFRISRPRILPASIKQKIILDEVRVKFTFKDGSKCEFSISATEVIDLMESLRNFTN